jgi:preprotein translocase subunit SecA
MIAWFKKLFGTSHERAVARLKPKVVLINDLEAEMKELTDDELRGKTGEFREKLDQGAKLEDILVPAFAVCREAGRRVLRMRHYDVQLIGGMVLHQGCIAEMRTGEGKTLVATLPCYLNALEGKGVHVVTVNDYLARRDAEWMGKIYGFLGLETGVVVNQQGDAEKKKAYKADITYGQNNEFGFDYLRDNMKFSALDYMQRPLNYAIVDEVDSILIDEARTPLIISGQAERSSDKYKIVSEVVPRLRNEEHYAVDEKGHSVTLTDDGVDLSQKLLSGVGVLKGSNLYDPENLETLHILNQCLRAHTLYKRDVNYIVREGKVMIVDEFTGRILAGRRWSDGLHQAIEAKENVRIQEESRTMATITFQNLFRLYKKLSGMTGTADTEAAEFHATYKLDVTIIPTNKNIIRKDHEDVVYKTEKEKFTAVVQDILDHHDAGVPILVGTTSVEKSAAVAKMLQKKGIKHEVLNAKHHENEAYIVAQAGRKGAITVSTNMAGRGTDILLGGNPEMIAKAEFRDSDRIPEAEPEAFDDLVESYRKKCQEEGDEIRELGGLLILGTERHESRRIDNQLRGRAGRQGDPGQSKFYLSLEDDLMRIFAGDRVKLLMERMGMPDNEPIEHPWVTKSVENAQKKVEERNFDIRKNVLEYDDVMNSQRKTVYDLRQQLLAGRYYPDIVDEEGKPTGEKRVVKPRQEVIDDVMPKIGVFLGTHLEDPVLPHDSEGKPRELTREDFAPAKKAGKKGKKDKDGDGKAKEIKVHKLTEVDELRRLVYQGDRSGRFPGWGVVYDFTGKEKKVAEVYDDLAELVPQALTEQRERVLDLMDRILSSMVEESCPANRPPEDWDWGSIFEGMKETFGIELADDVAEFGDPESLAQHLFDLVEASYESKEKEIGLELILKVFRHIYLEELDRAWVDHLTDMEHLRDGIGLQGYGQKDPKQAYKKEGFNIFVQMVARVSSNVMSKLMTKVEVQRAEEEDEREMRELMRLAERARLAQPRHEQALPPGAATNAAEATSDMAPLLSGEMECPCGSGKAFSKCHGAEDEEQPGAPA